ncbi:PIN domain-containing protein [Mongoliimonas terrestris]|uniref:PIN domain-containing protein n=1 Tax=Mongoliimonas terrestris TaxID=1709001 RepID=UPI0009495A35|nr:hypothetical protein [Mongoliimonas terrestris]
MIGVDVHVLLRAVLLDDPAQSDRATRFFGKRGSNDPAVINAVVLAEFVMTLQVVYRMPVREIAGILRAMTESAAYCFPDREAVLRALRDTELSGGSFIERFVAEINDVYGCSSTATFDSRAARRAPFSAVP